MLLLAVGFGSISGIAGAFVSYQAPNMPTGPWIVVVASFLAAISFFFGTEKGLLYQWRKKYRIAKRIDQEHVLKSLFHLQERNLDSTFADLKEQLHMNDRKLKTVLGKLIRQGFIRQEERRLHLSASGWHQAARVVRLHRLWELYLTEVLKKNPEQVHDEAEAIEHIISEETEAKLEAVLNYPSLDPHDSIIPR
jgi:manganese/zinc/iron transport system permease protein